MNTRGFFAEIEHPVAGRLKMPARPCHFSRTPIALERPAPVLGEHNDLIYCERLGYAPDELRVLNERGVL
jgi:crotonobetainyl-CoA:carnitine CoA-transferase CaiB-like acyl-CoA transferase